MAADYLKKSHRLAWLKVVFLYRWNFNRTRWKKKKKNFEHRKHVAQSQSDQIMLGKEGESKSLLRDSHYVHVWATSVRKLPTKDMPWWRHAIRMSMDSSSGRERFRWDQGRWKTTRAFQCLSSAKALEISKTIQVGAHRARSLNTN